MTDRDLTPEEARAEVEAFMGEGWDVDTWSPDGKEAFVCASRAGIGVNACRPTYRTAVAALKQAWRDAVRPWMEAAIEAKLDTADVDGYAPTERVVDRVCEKGMSNG